jgi:hypothetical protein
MGTISSTLRRRGDDAELRDQLAAVGSPQGRRRGQSLT